MPDPFILYGTLPSGATAPVLIDEDGKVQLVDGADGGGDGGASLSDATPQALGAAAAGTAATASRSDHRHAMPSAAQVGADATGAAAAALAAHVAAEDAHPTYTTEAEAAAAAPVQSVAGRAGAVTLTASDVSGAVSSSDPRLSDARSPTAHIQAFDTIYGTPTTLAGYGVTDAVQFNGPGGTPSGLTLTNATGLPLTTGVVGVLPVASGGTGTATPGLVPGANVTITGSWPNQTINADVDAGAGEPLLVYATARPFAPFDGAAGTGSNSPSGTIHFLPFYAKRGGIVNRLQFRVTTALAGCMIQLAFYRSSNGLPTGLPVGVGSQVSGSATQTIVDTAFSPFLMPGLETMFVASNVSTGTTLSMLGLAASNLYPWNVSGGPSSAPSNSANICYNYTLIHPFGTFPDVTDQSFSAVFGASRAPVVWFDYSEFV